MQHEQPSSVGNRFLRRVQTVADLVPLGVALLPAVLGIVWLLLATRRADLLAGWPLLLALLAAGYAFYRTLFSYQLLRDGNSPLYFELSLWPLLIWSAALMIGPPALWAALAWPLVHVTLIVPDERTGRRLEWLAAVVQNAAALVLPALVGLWLVDWLTAAQALAEPVAIVLAGIPLALVPATLLAILRRYTERSAQNGSAASLALFGRALGAALLLYTPALLARSSWLHLALFGGTLWLVNYLLAMLRRALDTRTQQAQRLMQLEQLAAALLNAPLEFAQWQPLLDGYLPQLFGGNPLQVRLLPDGVLYTHGATWVETTVDIGQALAETSAPFVLAPVVLAGDAAAATINAIIYPLRDPLDDEVVGGLTLVPQVAGRERAGWLPTLRAVADQLAAAVKRVNDYRQILDYQAQIYKQELYAQAIAGEVQAQRVAYDQLAREMALARDIQMTLLPRFAPDVDGWDLSVTFKPAGEASGDFYDFIPLPDGKLGLLIADVAGKGMGSALYMALSKTLLRAFALEPDVTPARVLAHANERMVADTQGEWMVTVFYGILDPASGTLTYANAGHHPPMLWPTDETDEPLLLLQSGMPMGIFTTAHWRERTVTVEPGGTLVLYTDGITEAFDEQNGVYGEARLIQVVTDSLGRPAGAIEARVIRSVEAFTGAAAQSDDLALIVVVRD